MLAQWAYTSCDIVVDGFHYLFGSITNFQLLFFYGLIILCMCLCDLLLDFSAEFVLHARAEILSHVECSGYRMRIVNQVESLSKKFTDALSSMYLF